MEKTDTVTSLFFILFFLRAEESQDFGSQEADEGFRKHFSRLLCCVVEEVLWMSQNVKQRLHQLLVLMRKCTNIEQNMSM